jgi:hypothetical protein
VKYNYNADVFHTFVQGKENAYADKSRGYTTTHDSIPYPDPPYTSYCKGYDEAYYFNWERVASAVGERSIAISLIHEVLQE